MSLDVIPLVKHSFALQDLLGELSIKLYCENAKSICGKIDMLYRNYILKEDISNKCIIRTDKFVYKTCDLHFFN